MNQIPLTDFPWPDITCPDSEFLPRTVIIDGANVMRSTSDLEARGSEFDEKGNGDRQKVRVASFLSFIRYLIKNNFDVIVISQAKYSTRDSIEEPDGDYIMEVLQRNHLLRLATVNDNDDLLALEVAKNTAGVVLSNDGFRDHILRNDRFATLSDAAIIIHYNRVPQKHRHHMSENGHYIADYTFSIRSSQNLMFISPKSLQFELAKYYRDISWSEKRREKLLEVLDGLLLRIRKKLRLDSEPASVPNLTTPYGINSSSESFHSAKS